MISSSTFDQSSKYPMITSRPGTIGIVESIRNVNMFNRPRFGAFTKKFHGIMFENTSMENYERVKLRIQRKAQAIEERTKKLKDREDELRKIEAKRLLKRKEQKQKKERKKWLQKQAAKLEGQRVYEAKCAVKIQSSFRAMKARQTAIELKEKKKQNQAALTIQKSSRRFVSQRKMKHEELEKVKREEEAAAIAIQRQARKYVEMKSFPLSNPNTDITPSSPVPQALGEEIGVQNSRDNIDRKDSFTVVEEPAHPPPDVVEIAYVVKAVCAPSVEIQKPQKPASVRVGGGFRKVLLSSKTNQIRSMQSDTVETNPQSHISNSSTRSVKAQSRKDKFILSQKNIQERTKHLIKNNNRKENGTRAVAPIAGKSTKIELKEEEIKWVMKPIT